MSTADELKAQGNKAFAAKDYDAAIALFSRGLELDAANHVLWSNRSAAKAGKRDWAGALEDAEKCVSVNPSWSKGYARKGAALHGDKRYDDAIAAYEAGLQVEDSAPLRKGLEEVKAAKAADERDEAAGLGKMFTDPNLMGKLASNPRTAKHLADPTFRNTMAMVQQNPALANSLLSSGDPRMIDVLGALMGIDMQGFSRPEGSDEMPPGVNMSSSSPPPPPQPKASPPPPQPAASSSKPAKEDVEMKEPEPPVDEEETKAKAEAEAEKKKGAEAYKKRDLETARTHFSRAWEVWPKDITFLTNLSAVYFEQGDYTQAISTAEKAVDEGRELRADYKLIAKALGRIGSAHAKTGDLAGAIKFFNKSLTEHRTPDVLNKLREAEKAQADAEKAAYVDPAKSAEAREAGNASFKAGDWPGAVKHYTEAIKRDPKDARGYNNRANAYTKLMALSEALKDADAAIALDGAFVKAYVRKSAVLFAMREYTRALEAVQEATEHDDGGKHTREIQDMMYKINAAMSQERQGETEEQALNRAMKDPEVANIMNDPVMQSILQQAQGNPQALQDHMKNPSVRQKIMKLVNAGIIKTR